MPGRTQRLPFPPEAVIGDIGRVMLMFGGLLVATGGALLLAEQFGIPRLPGDLEVKRGPVTFFFPIATSLVISILLTILLNLLLRRG